MRRVIIVCLVLLGLAACGEDQTVSRGADLYAANCAICHGGDLRGGGGAGVVGLSRTPADLTMLSFNNGGVFPTAMVVTILDNYAAGTQRGRVMRPFVHLTSDDRKRIKTTSGRLKVPAPQAALLAFLQTSQVR